MSPIAYTGAGESSCPVLLGLITNCSYVCQTLKNLLVFLPKFNASNDYLFHAVEYMHYHHHHYKNTYNT